ncbi:hypothetical protein [Streptomyces sp. NPDC001678]|uniref:hypothetical protein n=1 Tax=Streptomyces sp. NPDC001678 TaxID=3364599 RepID=UPI003697FD4D
MTPDRDGRLQLAGDGLAVRLGDGRPGEVQARGGDGGLAAEQGERGAVHARNSFGSVGRAVALEA